VIWKSKVSSPKRKPPKFEIRAALAALFWSDSAFPSVMKKANVFMPVVALAFAIESILIDRIADRLRPSRT
jgi:hypothetical protein